MSNKLKADAATSDDYSPTGFLPNELDLVDSATYNFRLFMINEKDASEGKVFNLKRQEVIAQSGVTADVEIDNVDVLSLVGMSAEAHTGTSTKIEFTLRQAASADLLDRIYDISERLEISNYTKLPFYLELKFRGRQPETSLDNVSLRNKVWIWPILITKMNIEVNAGGSTYRCLAMVYNDMAYTDEFGSISKDMKYEVRTVKEYFDKLGADLTQRQVDEYANKQDHPDEWVFHFDDELQGEAITSSAPDTNSSRSGSFTRGGVVGTSKLPPSQTSFASNNATSYPDYSLTLNSGSGSQAQRQSVGVLDNRTIIQFNDGTDVLRAIDAVLANTYFMQKLVKNSLTADGNAEEQDAQRDKMFKRLYRVYTKTEVIGYDSCRGDYARRFSYFVKLYDVATIVSEQPPKDVSGTNSRKKVQELRKRNYLQKRYDYIFTGLNDQVLDFNMDFSMSWYISNPRQSGINTDGAANPQNAVSTPTTSQDQVKAIKAKKCISAALKPDETIVKKGPQTTAGATFISQKSEETEQELAYGVEGKVGDGRNVLASLFNQVTTADMMKLDLVIKGDPYWLEPSPYQRYHEEQTLEGIVEEVARIVEFSAYQKAGQMMIMFTSRFPTIEAFSGDQTGGFTNNQAINGIYHVTRIDSKFQGGQFKQTLTCIREKTIDLNKVPEVLFEQTR